MCVFFRNNDLYIQLHTVCGSMLCMLLAQNDLTEVKVSLHSHKNYVGLEYGTR